ncbi:MAG: hypothetical protein ABIO55_02075 [Ginsengibacter sp.]
MQFKLVFLCLFSVTLTSVSCKKESPKLTVVKGEVRNALTAELVPNIPLYILECDAGFYIGADRCTDFKTVYTDLSGHFNFSFQSKKGSFYKIGIGINDKIPATEYFGKLINNQENLLNFSENPLKILQLKITILRHDKNWVNISASSYGGNYWSYNFYFGRNPPSNFDTTYNINIPAGRQYILFANLSNKVAEYTYQNDELFNKYFFIENVDTTKI